MTLARTSHRDDRRSVDLDVGLDVRAKVPDEGDLPRDTRLIRLYEHDRFRTNRDRRPAGAGRQLDVRKRAARNAHMSVWPGLDGKKVGRADEIGHEGVGRLSIDL